MLQVDRSSPGRFPAFGALGRRVAGLALAAALAAPKAALAGLIVSPLILDMPPNQASRGDVELQNNSSERLFVVVEPSRIDHPGLAGESRVTDPDPETLGLIATPNRLILEPNQRKFLRLAALQPPGAEDRIFRVVVKPVTGEVTGGSTGLKLIFGYEMLVIQRAASPRGDLQASRDGAHLIVKNSGNTNVELFRGKQCDPIAMVCGDLPGDRLYAGAVSDVPIKPGAVVTYTVKILDKTEDRRF